MDVVPYGDAQAVTAPDRFRKMPDAVGALFDLVAVAASQPGEPARLHVVDAEARLAQVLELTRERVEQFVPVPVLVDGEEKAAVTGDLGDHSWFAPTPAGPTGALESAGGSRGLAGP